MSGENFADSHRDLFEYARTAERAVVTYNRDDFLELDRRYRNENRRHRGIVSHRSRARRVDLHQPARALASSPVSELADM